MNFRSAKIDRKRFLGFQLCFALLQNTSTVWKICFPWTQVGGESACPQQSGARAGAAFSRQNSHEVLSLHSAFVSKSSEVLCTYLFFFFFGLSGFHGNAGFSEKRKPGCTLHTGSTYYFWSQLSCEHVPKCQHEQVLKGKAKIQMEGVRPNCLLELHIQIGYRAPACHRQYKMHLGKHWFWQKAGYRIKQYYIYSLVASIKACLISSWEIQRHSFFFRKHTIPF